MWSVFVGRTSERNRKPSTKEARRRREEGFGPTDRFRNSKRVFPCLNRFNSCQVFEHYGDLLIDVLISVFCLVLKKSECLSECFGAGSFVTDRVVVVISKKIEFVLWRLQNSRSAGLKKLDGAESGGGGSLGQKE